MAAPERFPWTSGYSVWTCCRYQRTSSTAQRVSARSGCDAGFAWFQLVYPGPEDPSVLATAILAYGAVTLAAALAFGPEVWFAKGDPFAIFLRLLAAVAPMGGGRLRWPGAGLLSVAPLPLAGTGFVLLMLASSITSQISTEELTAVANNVQSDTYRSFEVYILVALVYLALSAIYRLAFWVIGLGLFTRKRKLGTAL